MKNPKQIDQDLRLWVLRVDEIIMDCVSVSMIVYVVSIVTNKKPDAGTFGFSVVGA